MVDTPVSSSCRGVAALGCGFEGQILLPGDDGYDQARRVWNAIVDRRPAVIARPASTAGVAAAVRFGRDRELEIGVRGGGCSWRCGPVGWCERGAAAWTAGTPTTIRPLARCAPSLAITGARPNSSTQRP